MAFFGRLLFGFLYASCFHGRSCMKAFCPAVLGKHMKPAYCGAQPERHADTAIAEGERWWIMLFSRDTILSKT